MSSNSGGRKRKGESKKESKKADGMTEAARAFFSGSKKKKKSDADKTRTRDLLNTQNKGKRLLLGTYVYNGKILPGIDDHLLQCSVVEVNPDCKTCTLKFETSTRRAMTMKMTRKMKANNEAFNFFYSNLTFLANRSNL